MAGDSANTREMPELRLEENIGIVFGLISGLIVLNEEGAYLKTERYFQLEKHLNAIPGMGESDVGDLTLAWLVSHPLEGEELERAVAANQGTMSLGVNAFSRIARFFK